MSEWLIFRHSLCCLQHFQASGLGNIPLTMIQTLLITLARCYDRSDTLLCKRDVRRLVLAINSCADQFGGYIPGHMICAGKKFLFAGSSKENTFPEYEAMFAMIKMLTGKGWPDSAPPVNTLTFIGTPNLVLRKGHAQF